MTIELLKPSLHNFEEVKSLFSQTVADNFKKEGNFESHKVDLKQEVDALIANVAHSIRTQGEKEYYLLASIEGTIVATIAYGKANSIIQDHLPGVNANIPEIKSVYILPRYQRKGIGTFLFAKIQARLVDQGIQGFYLDCGYSQTQPFWKKKLGEPVLVLKDYWGPNADHFIWEVAI